MHPSLQNADVSQRRSEGFWGPGIDFRLAPPFPFENFVIRQNLQNRFKLFTKFDYLKTELNFQLGNF